MHFVSVKQKSLKPTKVWASGFKALMQSGWCPKCTAGENSCCCVRGAKSVAPETRRRISRWYEEMVVNVVVWSRSRSRSRSRRGTSSKEFLTSCILESGRAHTLLPHQSSTTNRFHNILFQFFANLMAGSSSATYISTRNFRIMKIFRAIPSNRKSWENGKYTVPKWIPILGPYRDLLTTRVPIFIKSPYFSCFRLLYVSKVIEVKPVCLQFAFKVAYVK